MIEHNVHYKSMYYGLAALQNNRFHVKDLIVTIVAMTEIFQWT